MPVRAKPDPGDSPDWSDNEDSASEHTGTQVCAGCAGLAQARTEKLMPSTRMQATDFSSLLTEIDACIALLGGKVVPRLNWSCPTDAAWISATQSIACTSADEVGTQQRGRACQAKVVPRLLPGHAEGSACAIAYSCMLRPHLMFCIAAGGAAAEKLGSRHARCVRRLRQLP